MLYIALVAILFVPFDECGMISSRVFDGIGKTYHSLILSYATIIIEIGAITLFEPFFGSGLCVLFGILVAEGIYAITGYGLLMNILNGKNRMEARIATKKQEKG